MVDHDGINWMFPLHVFQLQLKLMKLFRYSYTYS